jgi:hypothetical protein
LTAVFVMVPVCVCVAIVDNVQSWSFSCGLKCTDYPSAEYRGWLPVDVCFLQVDLCIAGQSHPGLINNSEQ